MWRRFKKHFGETEEHEDCVYVSGLPTQIQLIRLLREFINSISLIIIPTTVATVIIKFNQNILLPSFVLDLELVSIEVLRLPKEFSISSIHLTFIADFIISLLVVFEKHNVQYQLPQA